MLNMFCFAMGARMMSQEAGTIFKLMVAESLGGTLLEVFDGDCLVGYKLTKVVPGKAWDTNGFREGDLMLFNDENPCPLETPEDVLNVIASRANSYRVMRTKSPNC